MNQFHGFFFDIFWKGNIFFWENIRKKNSGSLHCDGVGSGDQNLGSRF